MNRMKIYQIVEYLKHVDFYHDSHDLEEMGVVSILSEYGIHNAFTDQELQAVSDELHPLAERNEFREAARLAGNSESVAGLRMVDLF